MRLILCLVAIFSLVAGCTKKEPLGSAGNPVKLFFMPSIDAGLIQNQSKQIVTWLEANTPYKYEVRVPSSFIAVVEAFGTKRADIAWINTFGYLLAHKKYGAEAKLILTRYGSASYRSQFLARKEDNITTLEGFQGKRFAFVDPSSISGYMLPAKMLSDAGVSPSQTVFAQKHDNVVTMLYQGQVDGGATFYSPPNDGKIQDARRLVKTQFPDVEEKINIVTLTQDIPNDPVVVRGDLPEAMKTTIINAIFDYSQTVEGKEVMKGLYGSDNFMRGTDASYEVVREIVKKLGIDLSKMVK